MWSDSGPVAPRAGAWIETDGRQIMYVVGSWYTRGYPLCKKCLDRNNPKNAQQQVQPDGASLAG